MNNIGILIDHLLHAREVIIDDCDLELAEDACEYPSAILGEPHIQVDPSLAVLTAAQHIFPVFSANFSIFFFSVFFWNAETDLGGRCFHKDCL